MDLKNINSISLNNNTITDFITTSEELEKCNPDKSILSLSVLKQLILQEIYPIGSIYMNQSDGRDPSEILGFGKWKQIVDKYIYANKSPEENGDNYITMDMIPEHKHDIKLWTQGAGAHTHKITVKDTWKAGNRDNTESSGTWDNGWTREMPWTTSDPGDHTHYINGYSGNSGKTTPTAYKPKYQSFYVWYRTG